MLNILTFFWSKCRVNNILGWPRVRTRYDHFRIGRWTRLKSVTDITQIIRSTFIYPAPHYKIRKISYQATQTKSRLEMTKLIIYKQKKDYKVTLKEVQRWSAANANKPPYFIFMGHQILCKIWCIKIQTLCASIFSQIIPNFTCRTTSSHEKYKQNSFRGSAHERKH